MDWQTMGTPRGLHFQSNDVVASDVLQEGEQVKQLSARQCYGIEHSTLH